MHFVKYGSKEGRSGTGADSIVGAVTVLGGTDYSLVYDYNYYTKVNPNVKNAFSGDDMATRREIGRASCRERV